MTYIIAEAACAHNGNIQNAIGMIDVAMAAGCDAVKFQAFNPDYIPNITEYEKRYLEKVQFNKMDFEQLRDYAGNRGVDFFLTPFDFASVDLCIELGMSKVKIPSGRLTDGPFVQYIQDRFDNLIVSTGMLEQNEIIKIKKRVKAKWLHCVTAYPAPEDQLNLNVLKGKTFDGLSDHTISTWVPAIAVACGAEIIEKHFTLSRGLPGPDQRCSLEPVELMDMVKNVRDVEKMLGSGKKRLMPCEQDMKYRKVNRKCERKDDGKTK